MPSAEYHNILKHPRAMNVTPLQSHDSACGNNTGQNHEVYNKVLLSIYTVVLLSGITCLVLTMRVLKFASHSLTTIAVLNLVFAHFLFLVTLPFRIYYYAVGQWTLGDGLCKAVSSMIHVHLYMSFVCYVVILVTRLLLFHKRANQVEFHRRTHALIGSLAIWVVVVVVLPCVISFTYGNKNTTNETCFDFGKDIKDGAMALNYVSGSVIIGVSVVLTGLQAHVLLVLYREHGRTCFGQQVFAAQLKSLCFALVMMVCFVPYHMFRMYYISHLTCQHINEVFLSLTTLNCLDMLTFLGKGTWLWCYK
ncbi:probable G-protein coupled receptor 141 [Gadus morhua]|uniref:probable G-protein coupled receptor 141 n=1 Tax=Gadus morhua TaxID=8049 RepID=UPI0011B35F05|nr:probable G-protein coupled receptor 141 [Gadus morhua]